MKIVSPRPLGALSLLLLTSLGLNNSISLIFARDLQRRDDANTSPPAGANKFRGFEGRPKKDDGTAKENLKAKVAARAEGLKNGDGAVKENLKSKVTALKSKNENTKGMKENFKSKAATFKSKQSGEKNAMKCPEDDVECLEVKAALEKECLTGEETLQSTDMSDRTTFEKHEKCFSKILDKKMQFRLCDETSYAFDTVSVDAEFSEPMSSPQNLLRKLNAEDECNAKFDRMRQDCEDLLDNNDNTSVEECLRDIRHDIEDRSRAFFVGDCAVGEELGGKNSTSPDFQGFKDDMKKHGFKEGMKNKIGAMKKEFPDRKNKTNDFAFSKAENSTFKDGMKKRMGDMKKEFPDRKNKTHDFAFSKGENSTFKDGMKKKIGDVKKGFHDKKNKTHDFALSFCDGLADADCSNLKAIATAAKKNCTDAQESFKKTWAEELKNSTRKGDKLEKLQTRKPDEFLKNAKDLNATALEAKKREWKDSHHKKHEKTENSTRTSMLCENLTPERCDELNSDRAAAEKVCSDSAAKAEAAFAEYGVDASELRDAFHGTKKQFANKDGMKKKIGDMRKEFSEKKVSLCKDTMEESECEKLRSAAKSVAELCDAEMTALKKKWESELKVAKMTPLEEPVMAEASVITTMEQPLLRQLSKFLEKNNENKCGPLSELRCTEFNNERAAAKKNCFDAAANFKNEHSVDLPNEFYGKFLGEGVRKHNDESKHGKFDGKLKKLPKCSEKLRSHKKEHSADSTGAQKKEHSTAVMGWPSEPEMGKSEKTAVCPKGCVEWHDGCNTCSCAGVGKIGFCTEMACDSSEVKPRCAKYANKNTSDKGKNDKSKNFSPKNGKKVFKKFKKTTFDMNFSTKAMVPAGTQPGDDLTNKAPELKKAMEDGILAALAWDINSMESTNTVPEVYQILVKQPESRALAAYLGIHGRTLVGDSNSFNTKTISHAFDLDVKSRIVTTEMIEEIETEIGEENVGEITGKIGEEDVFAQNVRAQMENSDAFQQNLHDGIATQISANPRLAAYEVEEVSEVVAAGEREELVEEVIEDEETDDQKALDDVSNILDVIPSGAFSNFGSLGAVVLGLVVGSSVLFGIALF